MPIKLVATRNKKTQNIYIRGTYLGVKVDQSSGTPKRSVARRLRDELDVVPVQRAVKGIRKNRPFAPDVVVRRDHRTQFRVLDRVRDVLQADLAESGLTLARGLRRGPQALEPDVQAGSLITT